ncbi:MAG: hypothetical protein QM758_15685 [Armatimonas sp.]
MQKDRSSVGQIGVMLIVAGVAIWLAVVLGHILLKLAWPLILVGVILTIIAYALPGRRR